MSGNGTNTTDVVVTDITPDDDTWGASPDSAAATPEDHSDHHNNDWANHGHHHFHAVDADGNEIESASDYVDATQYVDADGNVQSAPKEYTADGVEMTRIVSHLSSILESQPNIVCDPAKFNRYCDQNANLPHKVALIEVDNQGPKRIYVALSHGADSYEGFSMSDVMMRVINEANTPAKFAWEFVAEEDDDAANRAWEEETFGVIPRAYCRPTDPLTFEFNQRLLLNPTWCNNDNEMCLQHSDPSTGGDYSLSTRCDGLPCGNVIIVNTYETGKLIEDYLPLFCAYATHHRMHRIPRASASSNNRRLIGDEWSGHAVRDEFQAFLPIFSAVVVILALVWMIKKRVQALQRKYDAINNHEELTLV